MIKRFKPPRGSQIHTPAQLFTIPASTAVSKTFQGLDGKAFGFNRMIIESTAPTQMRVKAVLNNDKTIFDGVHISALKELFESKTLFAPFIIGDTNNLTITITDESGADQVANVMLAGYDHIALDAYQEYQMGKYGRITKPVFLYGSDTLTASQTRKLVEIPKKAVDVTFYSMAIGSDSLSNVLLSLNIYNDEIKSQVFASQINDEFRTMRSMIPYRLAATVPFRLFVTNRDAGNAHNISFIAEAYI